MSEKKKYNFYDLKKGKEITADVNAICKEALLKIDPTGDFVRFFEEKEQKRLFGTMNFFRPSTGRLIASFEMQHGVCKMFKLCEFMGTTDNHFFRTIMNENVSFERDRK